MFFLLMILKYDGVVKGLDTEYGFSNNMNEHQERLAFCAKALGNVHN